jgi:hypothetical protein
VAIERRQPRSKQAMDGIKRKRVTASVIGPHSAFNLRSLAFLIGAILGGVFLILFLLAFLPWLLAGALTAAVEGIMRRIGFSTFAVDGVGDWVLVLVVGLLVVAFLVIVLTFIAGIANFLSRLTIGRDRGRAVPARSRVSYDDRSVNGAIDGAMRETRRYEQRTVEELYAEARHRDVPGRSQMNKAQLIRALRRR